MNDIEGLARQIVHSAIHVHKALGPGLLESVYQRCLAYELNRAGVKVKCEISIPVKYEKIEIDLGFRNDSFFMLEVLNRERMFNWFLKPYKSTRVRSL